MRGALAGLLLVVLVAIAFWPATRASFVWDDDANVTENVPLRSADGLRALWLEPGATTQYYPMVYTTFWLERRAFELEPLGYHVDNILLHAANALLLWRLLLLLGVPGAWLAAAIFGIHPVQVDTVAWVTERKNLLSLFFYLLSAIAWLRFASDATGAREKRPGGYALCLILYMAALLSKVTAVTLGPALLVVAWWKKGRIARDDFLSVLPMLALALPIGLLTRALESRVGSIAGFDWSPTPIERVLQASRALCFYLGKLVWPSDLAFVYPRWSVDASDPLQYLPLLFVLGLTVVLYRLRGQLGRGPLAAWLFFAGTLAPVLGLLEVYYFRFAYVADHWQYVACIGPITLGAAVATRLASQRGAARRRVGASAAAALLGVLTVLTWQQSRTFETAETLWRDSLSKNPDSLLARFNLGTELQRRARDQEALEQYRLALALDPGAPEIYVNMGLIHARRGDLQEAAADYRHALALDPDRALAHWNLGLLLEQQSSLQEALPHLYRSLEIISPHAGEHTRRTRSHSDLGNLLLRHGRTAAAIPQYRAALSLDPEYLPARLGFARAHLQLGDRASADTLIEGVLRDDPEHSEALQMRARIRGGPGR